MKGTAVVTAVDVRRLTPAEPSRGVGIDTAHCACSVPDPWARAGAEFLGSQRDRVRIAFGAEAHSRWVGHLLAESRAFEFGSKECGSTSAAAVDSTLGCQGGGSTLLGETCRRFRWAGIDRVWAMGRRGDVPVLAYFRAHGFVAGEFTQVELSLDPVENR